MAYSFYVLISSESYGTEISLGPWKERRRFERAAIKNGKKIFRDAIKYQNVTEVKWYEFVVAAITLFMWGDSKLFKF